MSMQHGIAICFDQLKHLKGENENQLILQIDMIRIHINQTEILQHVVQSKKLKRGPTHEMWVVNPRPKTTSS